MKRTGPPSPEDASANRAGNRLLIVAVALSLAAFAVDVYTPRELIFDVPYSICVLLTVRRQSILITFRMALFVSMLSMLGAILSPPSVAPESIWFVNRSLGLIGIWIIAGLAQSFIHETSRRRMADEKFRDLVESSPSSLLLIDAAGNIQLVNREAERLFGYSRAELLGKSFDLLVSREQREGCRDGLQQYVAYPQAREFGADGELLGLRKNGEGFPIRVGLKPLVADKQSAAILATVIDISHQKQTEEQLREFNELLEVRVAERTALAERRSLQLRRLAAGFANAEQRERRRLAQQLHDHLQQLLVAAKMHVGAFSKSITDERTKAAADKINELLSESIDASRTLTVELSPPVLHEGGLVPALEFLANWMQQKHGLRVTLDAAAACEPDAEDTRLLLFQATRELLLNVLRHSGVKEAAIRVSRLAGKRLEIEVIDCGNGFNLKEFDDRPHDSPAYGLSIIRERLEFLGGEFEIKTAPQGGCRLRLIAPLSPPEGEFSPPSSTIAKP